MEKTEKVDLENALSKVLSLRGLNTKIKRVLADLMQNIKEFSNVRYDKYTLMGKLTAKEQRYHTLNKNGAASGTYQREISMLKSSIDRER